MDKLLRLQNYFELETFLGSSAWYVGAPMKENPSNATITKANIATRMFNPVLPILYLPIQTVLFEGHMAGRRLPLLTDFGNAKPVPWAQRESAPPKSPGSFSPFLAPSPLEQRRAALWHPTRRDRRQNQLRVERGTSASAGMLDRLLQQPVHGRESDPARRYGPPPVLDRHRFWIAPWERMSSSERQRAGAQIIARHYGVVM